ncbi:bifunctional 4-hydroxy-2-oxoglutarate aldolase/2-dehydro-3-deoxy-phosphogluconate aldolase [Pedobacter duraquae]|uniref:2-dehydro-3-deoxyphosphogluconate aldolase/(4S)-4-hydroxy-2-oxoglutarate aldolase n=1 Tax=Pedobacter duraquae TaxID=425511 RepID=A0A4R6IKY8_9SPHI|nr:bifunctional 4-hydroxy-2-oxoglutarate aldolase/2-dehydro-3-deoxy-phosphogluconate aldolase [Pedobacter duraquae]TDO22774.1 2-dehydro-3-deoxyphosphogluconate aldolase/(4S)-4-hydroxy-2-oxoglutarate aldolase [Pedobacter duraquae]
MKTKESAIKAITDQGLLPLFFYEDAEVSLQIIRTLYKAGVRVLEYTNRGKEALENFRYIMHALEGEMHDLFLGIGTIKNTQEARDFIHAGAHFIVAPVVDLEVAKIAHDSGLLWIPGCFTPTEVNLAHQNKAGIIKLFPANMLGPEYLNSIRDLFAGQLFIPTGGVEIEEENMKSWFKAGVCAVGMGSKLVSKDIMKNKDYDTLDALTRKTLEMVKSTR